MTKRRTNKKRYEVDPTLKPRLLEALTAGATIQDACAYVGITDETLRNWVKDDLEFLAAVNKARSTAKIASVGVIRKAAQSNWQAAAWFLERSDPQNWGRTTKVIMDVDATLQKRLNDVAKERGVDLASVFEAMINELAVSSGDREE